MFFDFFLYIVHLSIPVCIHMCFSNCVFGTHFRRYSCIGKVWCSSHWSSTTGNSGIKSWDSFPIIICGNGRSTWLGVKVCLLIYYFSKCQFYIFPHCLKEVCYQSNLNFRRTNSFACYYVYNEDRHGRIFEKALKKFQYRGEKKEKGKMKARNLSTITIE